MNEDEEPLLVWRITIGHETEGLDSNVCDNLRNVFDLERGEWYRRGTSINGGVLLFRG